MPSRRRLASQAAAHVLGPAVDAADRRVVGVADDAELGGEHDLVAPAARCARPTSSSLVHGP